MILQAHFYLINDDFSPEYADANHQGQESENNPRFEWEDEYEVSENLKEVRIHRQGSFSIQGQLPNQDTFRCELRNMCVIEMLLNDGQSGYFGVSESILDSIEEEKTDDTHIVRAYIKDYEPFGEAVTGVYLASKEFPTELIFE